MRDEGKRSENRKGSCEGIKVNFGKNGGHKPSGLGSKSIVVGDKFISIYENFEIQNL